MRTGKQASQPQPSSTRLQRLARRRSRMRDLAQRITKPGETASARMTPAVEAALHRLAFRVSSAPPAQLTEADLIGILTLIADDHFTDAVSQARHWGLSVPHGPTPLGLQAPGPDAHRS